MLTLQGREGEGPAVALRTGEEYEEWSGKMDSSQRELMESSASLFQSALGFDEGSGGLVRSQCLLASVVGFESPEETVARIREERDTVRHQLKQAAALGQQLVEQLEQKEEETAQNLETIDDLSRQASAMAREIEEKEWELTRAQQEMEALDEANRRLADEAEQARREELESSEPKPPEQLTASGSVLTKSQVLRRAADEQERRATEAERTAREKNELLIKLAADLERTKQEAVQLLQRNEQEVAERCKQNVSALLRCMQSCEQVWFYTATPCTCRPTAAGKPQKRRPRASGLKNLSKIEKETSKTCSARLTTKRRKGLVCKRLWKKQL